MKFNRVTDSETARIVLNELKVIPPKLIDITNEFGISVYCFNKNYKASWIGLCDKNEDLNDGRLIDEVSCYMPQYKAIIIYSPDIKDDEDEDAFSTIVHEYAHALDDALGNRNGKKDYLSYINTDIYKRWEQGKGLDCYANINPVEYFAQAFMAYIMDKNYKPWSYREHTRQELKEKDGDMFYYLRDLLNN